MLPSPATDVSDSLTRRRICPQPRHALHCLLMTGPRLGSSSGLHNGQLLSCQPVAAPRPYPCRRPMSMSAGLLSACTSFHHLPTRAWHDCFPSHQHLSTTQEQGLPTLSTVLTAASPHSIQRSRVKQRPSTTNRMISISAAPTIRSSATQKFQMRRLTYTTMGATRPKAIGS